jgi:hypothetical protein
VCACPDSTERESVAVLLGRECRLEVEYGEKDVREVEDRFLF